MKNKIIILILLISFNNIAQNLTLTNLLYLQGTKFDNIHKFMINNNYEYFASKYYYDRFYNGDNIEEYNEKVVYVSNYSDNMLIYYGRENYENSIGYVPQNFPLFKNLQSEAKNKGFRFNDIEVFDDELIQTASNGIYEIIFITVKNDSYYKRTSYHILIYNKKEIEDRKRLKIQQQEIENRQKYIQDSTEYRQREINDSLYAQYIQNAKIQYSTKNYNLALENYRNAYNIKTSSEIRDKIRKVEDIISFLKERENKCYNYKEHHIADYDIIKQETIKIIKEYCYDKNIVGNIKFNIIFKIDTNNKTTYDINSNNAILNKLKIFQINQIKLKPVLIKDYYVCCKAEYNINIDIEEPKIIEYNKKYYNVDIPTNIDLLLYNGEYGKYKIHLQNRIIYDMDNKYNVLSNFSNSYIIKYKSSGGPKNALLSCLVPGLGVKNVTHGKSNGYTTMAFVYSLYACSGISKYIAEENYKKSINSTNKLQVNFYYVNYVNYTNGFYILAGIATTIWIGDIIWTLDKGIKNNKKHKQYKNNLKPYINPINKQTGFVYKF